MNSDSVPLKRHPNRARNDPARNDWHRNHRRNTFLAEVGDPFRFRTESKFARWSKRCHPASCLDEARTFLVRETSDSKSRRELGLQRTTTLACPHTD
jgi:hypothetical protein